MGTFVEQTVEIDMNGFTGTCIEKNVLAVSIAQTHDVANHRHDRRRANEIHSTDVPTVRIGIGSEEVLMEHARLMKGQQFEEVLVDQTCRFSFRISFEDLH